MLQAQVPCKGWWKPWDVLEEPRLWGHPLLLPSAGPQIPGGRGEAVEPQDLNARYKLLFQSKHLLPSLVKIVPMPSLCFLNLYLITFSLSPVCFATLRKHWNQQLCDQSRNSSSPWHPGDSRKATERSWEQLHGLPPCRSPNTPIPHLRFPGCDRETRRCYLELLIDITTSLFVSRAVLKTWSLSMKLFIMGSLKEMCVCSQSCSMRVPSHLGMRQSCCNVLLSPEAQICL